MGEYTYRNLVIYAVKLIEKKEAYRGPYLLHKAEIEKFYFTCSP